MKKRVLGIIFTLLLILSLFFVKCGDFTINEKTTTASTSSTPCTTCEVFITSATSSADLGGLSGADSTCKTLASAAGLTGSNWAAWLSTDSVDAKDRVNDAIYNLTNGTKVADDLDDLIDDSIDAAINVDENGNAQAGKQTFSGTNADGTKNDDGGGSFCTNWTAGDVGTARSGDSDATDGTWTNSAVAGCATITHFYCFEI